MSPTLKNILRRFVPRQLRNYLRHPGKALHWWINDLRIPIDLEIRPGWRLKCPRNALDVAFGLQLHDPPQMRELDEFISLVKSQPKVLLLDIGCHFGVFSFAAAHYGPESVRAVAVDASPPACKMVERIAGLNHVANKVGVIHAAVAASGGELEMISSGVGSAYYMVPPTDQPAFERTRIPTTTVDRLVEDIDEVPTVIKIDVESYEWEVLQGARKTLEQHSLPLCLELHCLQLRRRGLDPTSVIQLLAGFGYTDFSSDGRSISTDEILKAEIIRLIVRNPS